MISKIIPDGITVGELKTLDFDAKINALTVEDLGLNLEGLAAKVLKPDDTIGGLTDGTVNLNDRINNLKLSELGLNLDDGVISYVLQPDDTVALLTGTDGAKVMNDRINNITLNQFLGKDEEPGNKILNALLKKNIPVSG